MIQIRLRSFHGNTKMTIKATSIGRSNSHEHVDIQVTDVYNVDHLESA